MASMIERTRCGRRVLLVAVWAALAAGCSENAAGPEAGPPALDAETAERFSEAIGDVRRRIVPALADRGDPGPLPELLQRLETRLPEAPRPELLERMDQARAAVDLLYAGQTPLRGDPDLAVIDLTLLVLQEEVLTPSQ